MLVDRMDFLEIADAVVEHYGVHNQLLKLKEENLELADELKVYSGEITFELIDELADELFLLTQLARKIPAIKVRVMYKASRQLKRMEAEKVSDRLRGGILIDHYAGAVVEGAHGFME